MPTLAWYIAGPLIGLLVPALLLVGGRSFGVSANFRHLCAAALPSRLSFFRYDWRSAGLWNLAFILGTALGGLIAALFLFSSSAPVDLAASTVADLRALGLDDFSGLVPHDLVSWPALLTPAGLLTIVGGGFLIGFGARYAGGCTSGHAISGLAAFQLPSLVAVLGFFAGGLLMTYVLLPHLLS